AWRHSHAVHHATAGDLSRRGLGDIETATVSEYLAMTPTQRLRYRLYRNPFVMFGLGAAWVFFIAQRVPRNFATAQSTLSGRERASVHATTAGATTLLALLWLVGGWRLPVLVHAPAVALAGGIGIFLFYIQHQF